MHDKKTKKSKSALIHFQNVGFPSLFHSWQNPQEMKDGILAWILLEQRKALLAFKGNRGMKMSSDAWVQPKFVCVSDGCSWAWQSDSLTSQCGIPEAWRYRPVLLRRAYCVLLDQWLHSQPQKRRTGSRILDVILHSLSHFQIQYNQIYCNIFHPLSLFQMFILLQYLKTLSVSNDFC